MAQIPFPFQVYRNISVSTSHHGLGFDLIQSRVATPSSMPVPLRQPIPGGSSNSFPTSHGLRPGTRGWTHRDDIVWVSCIVCETIGDRESLGTSTDRQCVRRLHSCRSPAQFLWSRRPTRSASRSNPVRSQCDQI